VRATEVIVGDGTKENPGDGEPADRRQLAILLSEAEKALARGDLDLAESKIDDIRSLNLTVMTRQPWFWVGYLQYLEKEANTLGVYAVVAKHFDRGKRAVQQQDYGAIPGVCRDIVQMFPSEQRERVSSLIRSNIK
jgi:hypothetical protein